MYLYTEQLGERETFFCGCLTVNTQHLPSEDIQLLYSNNNLRPRHFLKANGS